MTRDMVLIKGNQIFVEAFGQKTVTIQSLGHRCLHIFMASNPLLAKGVSWIINRVKAKSSIAFILDFIQEVTTNIVDSGLQGKCIYNMDEIGFGQNSSTKRVIYVKRLSNLWGNLLGTNLI